MASSVTAIRCLSSADRLGNISLITSVKETRKADRERLRSVCLSCFDWGWAGEVPDSFRRLFCLLCSGERRLRRRTGAIWRVFSGEDGLVGVQVEIHRSPPVSGCLAGAVNAYPLLCSRKTATPLLPAHPKTKSEDDQHPSAGRLRFFSICLFQ